MNAGTRSVLILLAVLSAGCDLPFSTAKSSEDLGTRLRRECESVVREVPMMVKQIGVSSEAFVQSCIWRRSAGGSPVAE